MNEETFEERFEKLRGLVVELENGNLGLKDTMEKYKESLEIIKKCYKELEEAELKIESIIKENGEIIRKELNIMKDINNKDF